jgi:transcriptional regulator with GAF, ATPase, and Fis domain
MNLLSEIRPRLVGVAGPLRDKIVSLSGTEFSVGRDSKNDLWTVDSALSDRHCSIQAEDGRFRIRDLGSVGGTFVNGVRIEEQVLRDRDRVSVGNSVLIFVVREETVSSKGGSVELTGAADATLAGASLRPGDALYTRPERVLAVLPETDRLARDLNTLLKIANGIGSIRDRETLEWQLLGMVFDVVPADRAAILHFCEGIENLESAIAWDRLLGPRVTVSVPRAVVQRVLRERVGLLVRDAEASDVRPQGRATSLARSLLCVPFLERGKVTGMIYLDGQNPAEPFDQNHLEVMTGVANLVSLALENVRHWEGLREENRALRSEMNLEHSMVGASARMREVLALVQRVAPTASTVLIQGESGTGKELVARAIHGNSPRAERPFVAINCAALTESLLESEMFGHEKGAFTGAVTQKKGKIETAEGGTLFLDEVGELAAGMQAKLLRVLQEREFEPVGGTRSIKVNVRVIAATNKSLQDAVQSGLFREDLFYRLNVVSITTPPLRERREDIPALAESFVVKMSKKCKVSQKRLSPEAKAVLMQYDWPGNVRELENAIERAVVLGTAKEILPEDLPEGLLEVACPSSDAGAKFHCAVKEKKKVLVLQALEQANGHYVEAAKILGLHPNSLLRLIRNLGLKSAGKPGSAPPAAR